MVFGAALISFSQKKEIDGYLIRGQSNTSGQGDMVNLAGEWNIKLDPDGDGIEVECYKNSSFNNILRLPGCLQEQGYGNVPDIETKWWGGESLYQWFQSSFWLKDYQPADNFKTQAWLVPDRHYIGAAWYAKDIEIPKNWDGKHITLFLERCHWETKLWVDGNYIGSNLSLASPHIYDLSKISIGKHRIVLRVDNSEKVNLGKMPHSVSEQTAGTWNGIVGKLELRAEAPVWIDNLQLYPDIKNKLVKLRGTIGNLHPENGQKWELLVEVQGYNNGNSHNPESIQLSGALMDSTKTNFTFDYEMGDGIQLWDEFDPNLYKMTLTLHTFKDAVKRTNTKGISFGIRDFKKKGRQFAINGITTFLRGNTDCAVTPKTGYAPMDVESWKKIWEAYKDFGLNMARFHSWCPPEAAFIAADEVGIYLAPEVGEWTYIDKQEQFDFLQEEALKILNTYGNYSSFIQMGLGNESGGNKNFFQNLINEWKSTDSRHLYTIKANSNSNPANIDYEVVRSVGKEQPIKLRYQRGWPPSPQNTEFHSRPPQTDIDWNEGVLCRNTPLIQHETAQICAYPDLVNEIPKFDGYLNPTYLEIALEQLRARGMLDQLPDFVEASGKWQVELTREEFEAAYRTKELAGFHWLSLADFTGQNTAPVGFTDAFYDVKPYVNVSSVRNWNAPTVVLARMKKRIFTAGERFIASIEVTHYGKEKLLLDDLTAILKTSDGTILKHWKLDEKELTQGSAQYINDISHSLENITAPDKLVLELQSKKNDLVSDWNIWIFPDNKVVGFPKSIIVTNEWNTSIERKLKRGKTVLLLPENGTLKGQLPICFTNYYWTSFGENKGQSSAAGVLIDNKHPVFEKFPTENHVNWQWWDLLTQCQPMILDSYNTRNPWPKEYKPIIQAIDSWKINRKLALVAEAKIGNGILLICSINIETDIDKRPAAKQFRESLIDYISSGLFNPQTEITVEMVKELFEVNSDQYKKKNEKGMNLPADG